ncbi:MAG: beta strand repeat-containing protein [Thalassobaculum sp.]
MTVSYEGSADWRLGLDNIVFASATPTDTTPPTVSAPDLVASSDTGVLSTDNITDDATPTFAGTAEAGSFVSLLVNGVTVASGVAATGTGAWTLTAGSLSAGSYFVQAKATDAAGNVATSAGLGVTVTSFAPAPTLSAPDLVASSDSGISSTDNLTNVTNPEFVGTAAAGSTVSLLVNGVTASAAVANSVTGAWTLSAGSLASGSYFIQAEGSDGFGGTTTSSGVQIVIDTVAPTVSAPDLVASSDTGASSTDNVTEDATPTFSGTAEAGSFVSLLVNGVTVAGGIAATGTGAWTLTAGSLTAGSYFVQTSAQDAAGNTATSAGLGVTVEAPPPPPVSGIATFGVVTTLNTTTTLTSNESGLSISVTQSDGSAMAGVSSGFLDPGVIDASVSYSLSFSQAISISQLQIGEFLNLSSGSNYVFTPDSGTALTIADNSGSIVGAIATLTPADWSSVTSMTVSYEGSADWRLGLDNIVFASATPTDTTPPTVSAPDLLASSDTGVSSTDNITDDATPTFAGTAEAGSVVSLLVNGVTVASGVAATGTGAWTLTAGSLSAGSYFVQAKATDAAGNVATSAGLGVTVASFAPAPTLSAPDLVASSDSGISSTDNLTNVTSPEFVGTAAAGSTVSLLVNGVTASAAVANSVTGAWTLSAGSLASGSYFIQAEGSDGFGGTTTSSGVQIVVDTVAPTVSAPDLVASSDTGASSTDNITEDTTPTFTGTAEAGSFVSLLVNGVTVAGGIAATGTGAWTLTAGSLAAGSYFVQTSAQDAAGNAATSSGLGIEIAGTSVPGIIFGTTAGDVITGTAGADTISALGGNDTVTGLSGNDLIFGGQGADILSTGAGFDTVYGGDGNDTLVNNASISTEAGLDVLYGGDGDDLIVNNGPASQLFGGDGADTISGGYAGDLIEGGAGADVIDGAAGFNTASYANSDAGVSVNLSDGSAESGGHAQGDTLSNINSLIGSDYSDTLIADGGQSVISAGGGDDLISHGGGRDTLWGGAGNDTFEGSLTDFTNGINTDDAIGDYASGDVIRITGTSLSASQISLSANGATGTYLNIDSDSNGSDDVTINVTGVFTGAVVTAVGGDTEITLNTSGVVSEPASVIVGTTASEVITGTPGDDTISALSGSDTVSGLSGDDMIFAGAGSDIVSAGAGADTVSGGDDADLLYGQDGDDVLSGGGGFDTLSGGAGNDSLYADDNSDQMYGGAGDDRFYVPGSTVFAGVRSYGVTDFSGGEDTIVLSGATSAQILGSFTLGADRLLEIDLDGNSSTDMYLNVGSAADAFETVAGGEGVEIVATAVDSTPPTVSAPDLIAFNDSGISNTDNLTNVTTPTFTGTAEAGAFVSLLVDGVTVSGGVAFTLFGGTLSAGGWTLSAASLSQGLALHPGGGDGCGREQHDVGGHPGGDRHHGADGECA